MITTSTKRSDLFSIFFVVMLARILLFACMRDHLCQAVIGALPSSTSLTCIKNSSLPLVCCAIVGSLVKQEGGSMVDIASKEEIKGWINVLLQRRAEYIDDLDAVLSGWLYSDADEICRRIDGVDRDLKSLKSMLRSAEIPQPRTGAGVYVTK